MTDTGIELDLGDPLLSGVFFVTADDIATLDHAVHDAGLLARRIDLGTCVDKAGLLARMTQAMAIPDDRGRNWDALADSLRDLSWLPAPGYALLFDDAHRLRDGDEASFDTLLALLEETATDWAAQEVPFWAFLSLPDSEFEVVPD
jgi:RNAse (barnase) inhibitor barstar